MRPKTFDHVALWVVDRDSIAAFVTAHLGMHVIERTDKFTLVGSDARRGKLTLFAAEGPRERGAIRHVALRVSDLEAALEKLPADVELERPFAGEAYFDVSEGLRLGLVQSEKTEVEYDLDHAALFSAEPEGTARAYEKLGLCSTYSMRTRSGPQRKTAYVFAASTTLSTSTPSSSASLMCSSAESTRTARWFSNGLSGSPGSPGWNSTKAPPTSTRGASEGPGGTALKPSAR